MKREEEEKKERAIKKKNGSKAGYFISGLAGVIVGALLIWLLLPSLVKQLPGTTASTESNNSNTTINQTATEVTTDVTQAVEKVSDAVVGITNIQEVSTNFWNQPAESTQEAGSGSGVIYKIDGDKAYIITNYHVVEGAKQLEVTLADGSKVEAQLVGSDIWTDLAVISIRSENVRYSC